MSALLILSCTGTKLTPYAGTLPALELYAGPWFQTLRKVLWARPCLAERVEILILSAAHGLLPATRELAWYNQVMTPARASQLAPAVHADLAAWLATHTYTQILVVAGAAYRAALGDLAQLTSAPVTFAPGGLGAKRAYLHCWLKAR